jgi:uncharacterized protein VirK/YbjX
MKVKTGLAHLQAIKFLHHDKFLASKQLLPRHCASAHLQTSATETNYRSFINLLPRYTYTPANSYLDGKNTRHTLQAP